MKKVYALLAVAALLAGSAPADDRIVFANLERVFNEFYKTKLAKAKIEVQHRDVGAERQIIVDELTAMQNEVDTLRKEARDATLAEEVRDSKRIRYEERLLAVRAKQKELDEFTARRQQQVQLQVTRMSQLIMDEIRQTVTDYAKKEGFAAVIDSSSRQAAVSVFVYTRSDVDVTQDLLNLLNAQRPETMKGDDLFEDDTNKENKPADGGAKK